MNPMKKLTLQVRDPADFMRETKHDIFKMPRQLSKDSFTAAPFQAERQYQSALNAAKVERMLSKPFIGVCDTSSESVNVIATHPNSLGAVVFGSNDGKIIFWNTTSQSIVKSVRAHNDPIRGLTYRNEGNVIYSTGGPVLKQWAILSDTAADWGSPLATVTLHKPATCMDHHPTQDHFLLGSSDSLRLFHANKQLDEPVMEWQTVGHHGIRAAQFNPSLPQYIAACTSNVNQLLLFDVRTAQPVRQRRNDFAFNAICWNPQQPNQLICACQDYDVYSYDLRNWNKHLRLYRGHSNAVLDVHFASTGLEFATAGYDDTVRLWNVESTAPRDTYHTKRMKQVYTVRFTKDSRFVLSASADQNVRLWKAHASESLTLRTPREKLSLNQAALLRQTHSHHPQVKNVLKSHRLPKAMYNEARINQIQEKKIKRKEARVFRHGAPGKAKLLKLREKKAGEEVQ